ncbi:alpha/beta fold hydrolase [Sandarakinorhabdus sp.]|uniref:alpha/beta fold hydrolase n=1 Tax=Sandarakinorhabdus sp. TaxID=1916663 RepID=UPI00356A1746
MAPAPLSATLSATLSPPASRLEPAPGWQKGFAFTADSVRLCWREHHDPRVPAGRPALLCLAGLTRNGADFAHLAAALGADWRIIAPDLRGRGESGWARDSLTYVPLTYLRDLSLVLAAAGVERFVAVGSSLGGLLALRMTTAHRSAMAGVVLNDIGPAIEPAGLTRLRANVGRGGNWDTWVHAARDLGSRNEAIHPDWGLHDWLAFAKRLCRVGPQGRIIFDYDPRIAEPFRLPHGDAGADDWAAFDILAGVPVLSLRAERSDVLSAATQADMQRRLAGLTAVTVPGVGHAPTLAEPEAAASLLNYLDALKSGEK